MCFKWFNNQQTSKVWHNTSKGQSQNDIATVQRGSLKNRVQENRQTTKPIKTNPGKGIQKNIRLPKWGTKNGRNRGQAEYSKQKGLERNRYKIYSFGEPVHHSEDGGITVRQGWPNNKILGDVGSGPSRGGNQSQRGQNGLCLWRGIGGGELMGDSIRHTILNPWMITRWKINARKNEWPAGLL